MEKQCWFCLTELDITDLATICENCGQAQDFTEHKPIQNEEVKEMANLGDLRKNFKKEDVQTGDIISFVDAGEIKDIDFSQGRDGSDVKTVFQVTIKLPDGKNKVYIPNTTTRNTLSEKWGEDTELWVGKRAKVNLVDQLSFGKMTKVMILEPIEG